MNHTHMLRRLTSLALGGVVMLGAARAHATPNFPVAVQQHLQLAAAPACTLCHVGTPARGTVVTPFGASMRGRGLVAYDEGPLRTALDALTAEKRDSDKDGVADIAELVAATDPNVAPGAGGGDVLVPEYGCASGGSARTPGIAGALGVAALLALRRRGSRWFFARGVQVFGPRRP